MNPALAWIDRTSRRLDAWYGRFLRSPLSRAIEVEVTILAMVVFYFIYGAGQDLVEYYIPLAKGCFECALNPWYASWIFFPFRFIPPAILRALWSGFTIGATIWAARRLEVPWFVPLLAFPMFGELWLGQVDAVVLVGLVLTLTSKNPYVRGAGLVLASVKPQLSVVPMLILWIHDRDRWRTLLVPALLLIASAVVWGPDWPLRWFSGRRAIESLPAWGVAAIFPYGVVALGALIFVRGVREQTTVALLASAITLPWFGVYSYFVFLAFMGPWWAIPLSYVWMLGFPLVGIDAVRIAIILPMALLTMMVWPHVREWRERRSDSPASAAS